MLILLLILTYSPSWLLCLMQSIFLRQNIATQWPWLPTRRSWTLGLLLAIGVWLLTVNEGRIMILFRLSWLLGWKLRNLYYIGIDGIWPFQTSVHNTPSHLISLFLIIPLSGLFNFCFGEAIWSFTRWVFDHVLFVIIRWLLLRLPLFFHRVLKTSGVDMLLLLSVFELLEDVIAFLTSDVLDPKIFVLCLLFLLLFWRLRYTHLLIDDIEDESRFGLGLLFLRDVTIVSWLPLVVGSWSGSTTSGLSRERDSWSRSSFVVGDGHWIQILTVLL